MPALPQADGIAPRRSRRKNRLCRGRSSSGRLSQLWFWLLGLIATVVGLKHFEKLAARQQGPGRAAAAGANRRRGAGGL